jgi:tight adherence protein C
MDVPNYSHQGLITMPEFSIYFLALVFFITAGIAAFVIRFLLPDRLQQRLAVLSNQSIADAVSPVSEPPGRNLLRFLHPFARLALPTEGWEESPMRLRFMHAGWRGAMVPTMFFGLKTLLALGMPALIILFANDIVRSLEGARLLLLLSLLATTGFYVPNLFLNRAVHRRQQEIFENFPDVLDLLTICIEAGLSLDQAFLRVTEEIELKSTVLAQELKLVLLELRTGFSKEVSLRHLALRTGVEDIDLLVAMLIQTDRFGTNVGDALRVHSDNLRTQRRQRAEESAAKISVKLLMPLIFLIFPTLMLVLLGPAVIQIRRVLLPAVGQ